MPVKTLVDAICCVTMAPQNHILHTRKPNAFFGFMFAPVKVTLKIIRAKATGQQQNSIALAVGGCGLDGGDLAEPTDGEHTDEKRMDDHM